MNPTRFVPKHPQVKICGLTHPEEAVGCVELGADAIGCVFYPPSPRHLEQHQARDISLAVAQHAVIVGVFVNASVEDIMATVERCHLTAVQLHGREAPEVVQKLRQAGLTVVKALFVDGTPPLTAAGDYRASAFLIECAKGALPGGNALTWRWDRARSFGFNHPLILAGGLAPDNISQAITDAIPDAVDISSGVESAPGRKDLDRVAAFIRGVKASGTTSGQEGRPLRNIFK